MSSWNSIWISGMQSYHDLHIFIFCFCYQNKNSKDGDSCLIINNVNNCRNCLKRFTDYCKSQKDYPNIYWFNPNMTWGRGMQIGRRYNILIFQVKSVTLKSISAVRVDIYFFSVIIWSEMKSSTFTFFVKKKKKKWWRFLLKEIFFCPFSFGLISCPALCSDDLRMYLSV